MFSDWNHNGKRDASDSFVDFNMANGKESCGNGRGSALRPIIIIVVIILAYIVGSFLE